MKATRGRVQALQALEGERWCALPNGLSTKGFRITGEILAMLERHALIQRLSLTERALKKHRFVFVYTITDAGRNWLDVALSEKGFK